MMRPRMHYRLTTYVSLDTQQDVQTITYPMHGTNQQRTPRLRAMQRIKWSGTCCL
ncbi:hypothetical protein BDQ17DRAFT_1377374, partial [Cyathus striatus]